MFAPLFSENTAVQPGHRSATLCWLSGLRPHSSPDPFGATLPPGQCHKLKDSISKNQKGTAIIVQNTT